MSKPGPRQPAPHPPQGVPPLRTMVMMGTALGLLLAWAAVVTVLRVTWQDAMNAQVRQNSNLALILAEQTVRVLATVDQATLRMRDAVMTKDFDGADFRRLANETGLAPEILTQLSLVGPDGRFVGSNIDPTGEKTGHVDLTEREHVKVHLRADPLPTEKQQTTAGGLFVGKAVVGKVSGKATIQLSRRIPEGTGPLTGMVVASVNPGYFEDVYRGVQLGSSGIVTLVGDDRAVRARVVGGQSIGMGTVLASNQGSGGGEEWAKAAITYAPAVWMAWSAFRPTGAWGPIRW